MDTKNNEKKMIFSTPILKILDFLLLNPDQQYSDADINRKKIGIKKSAINSALRTLSAIGFVERKKQGQSSVNCLIQTKPVICFFKIISNLLEIEPVIKKCRSLTYKIILFGSRADGTHMHDSDFDIMVVTDDKTTVGKVMQSSRLPLQPILKHPEEMMRLHETEPSLWNAISKGIILWERT